MTSPSAESVRYLGQMFMGLGDRLRQGRQAEAKAEAEEEKNAMLERYRQSLMEKYEAETGLKQSQRRRVDQGLPMNPTAPKKTGVKLNPDQLLNTNPQEYIRQVSIAKAKMANDVKAQKRDFYTTHSLKNPFDDVAATRAWMDNNPFYKQYIAHSATNPKAVSLMGTIE